ncbi:LytR/AlgR family response regulator transcription factor [Namhaeicola litoreus]|uniref:LytR/AlgR family response regulator transcription factor n=1 Tax=Namhaeicola litoreus TaxID=1052145 RepID=A0ABW3XWT5_9FLAO
MIINCLIVDDEVSSQKVLEKFIKVVDFLSIVCICDNAEDALEKLQYNHEIDLLFLDINMPKISGITMYKSLQNPPPVIFTTAYSKYAIDGFDVNAIDFLLKPFSFDRFLSAVNKVIAKNSSLQNNLIKNNSILVKADKTIHKININDILFIEAYGDYVKIHLKDKYILTNKTFASILVSLPQNKFIQTHKSFAVNIDEINTLQGNQITIAHHTIPVGLTYKSNFLTFFK